MARVARFDSLFWKLFLLVWLTNVVVIALTSLFVFNVSEKRLFDQHFNDRMPAYVQPIIEDYEKHGKVELTAKEKRRLDKKLRHDLRRAKVDVYNEQGQLIYQRFRKLPESHAQKKLSITSESGKTYQVDAYFPDSRKWFSPQLVRLHFMQFIGLMLGAALVSFISTLLIRLPLIRLQSYSNHLAAGHFDHKIDAKLLDRRDIVGELARSLDAMATSLDNMIQSNQMLLNDVSHELRAPLARLQTTVALIEQQTESADDKTAAHLNRLHNECERMHALISRIMDYNRADHSADSETVDIPSLIEQQVTNCQFANHEHPIAFTRDRKATIEVLADPLLLASAIANVLENACQHTPAGTPISVHLTTDETHCIVRIQDRGPGINEDEKDKLLEPFYRASNRMHTPGFGLGFSIAKRSVEHFDGTLALENLEEGGLQVTIRLPLAK